MKPQKRLHYLRTPEARDDSTKTLSSFFLKRDLIKLAFVALTIVATCSVFFFNPKLSIPTLLSLLITLLLSPLVASMERRGFPRKFSIGFLFLSLGGVLTVLAVWATKAVTQQWESFIMTAPTYFKKAVSQIQQTETALKEQYAFLNGIHPTDTVIRWGEETGQWFINNSAGLVGDLLTWMVIIPFLSFVILSDGRKLRKQFFSLVPNRYFELIFMVTSRISVSLSEYIRAKAIEALLVGSIVSAGLIMIDGPYPTILGIIAGVTNIIPYIGPILGAIPGIAIPIIDPTYSSALWPLVTVYAVANAIDFGFIFPFIVAKLVNLHPVLLLTAVVLGGQYYGLVGMLISIPIATAIKIIIEEIHNVIYRSPRNPILPDRAPFSSSILD